MDWISVKSTPIPAGYEGELLIRLTDGSVMAAKRVDARCFDVGDYNVLLDAITHWMPMPEAEGVAELRLEIDQLRYALAHLWFAYTFKNPDEEHPYAFEKEALAETKKHLGSWQRAFAIIRIGEPK